jgi:hypothetical protein
MATSLGHIDIGVDEPTNAGEHGPFQRTRARHDDRFV